MFVICGSQIVTLYSFYVVTKFSENSDVYVFSANLSKARMWIIYTQIAEGSVRRTQNYSLSNPEDQSEFSLS